MFNPPPRMSSLAYIETVSIVRDVKGLSKQINNSL